MCNYYNLRGKHNKAGSGRKRKNSGKHKRQKKPRRTSSPPPSQPINPDVASVLPEFLTLAGLVGDDRVEYKNYITRCILERDGLGSEDWLTHLPNYTDVYKRGMRRAYLRLSMKYHPDKNPHGSSKMAALQTIYSTVTVFELPEEDLKFNMRGGGFRSLAYYKRLYQLEFGV